MTKLKEIFETMQQEAATNHFLPDSYLEKLEELYFNGHQDETKT